MNKLDLWAAGYYNAFHEKRTRNNMGQLLEKAGARGLDAFDPRVLETAVQKQDYIFHILMDDLLGTVKGEFPSLAEVEIEVLLRDREDFNANIEKESGTGNKYLLFIDDLMATAVFKLVNSLLYWNIVVEDREKWTKCFRYVLYVLTEYGEHRVRPASPHWAYELDMEMLSHQTNTTHLLADLNLVINAFIMLHELGHLALGHLECGERTLEQEFAADDFAYRKILSMIERQASCIAANHTRPELDLYEGYTYLAPLMFFDLMDLMELFRNRVYGDTSFQAASQKLAERKRHLEGWVYDSPDDYVFDTAEGNQVYNAFLNSIDRFTGAMESKMQKGKSLIPEEGSVSHADAAAWKEIAQDR